MGRRTLMGGTRKGWRIPVRALLAWTALQLSSTAHGQGVFERLQTLQASDRIQEALETATACSAPLERAQAQLFVLHHAGDLAGALTAGLAGLRAAPEDPWLLERTTTLALDLGATDLARQLLDRFEDVAAAAEPVDSWSTRADELKLRTAARGVLKGRAEDSLARAQWVAGLAGLLALACLVWAVSGRGGDPAAPSGADPVDP